MMRIRWSVASDVTCLLRSHNLFMVGPLEAQRKKGQDEQNQCDAMDGGTGGHKEPVTRAVIGQPPLKTFI